jgi:hypothetical protein
MDEIEPQRDLYKQKFPKKIGKKNDRTPKISISNYDNGQTKYGYDRERGQQDKR